MKNHADTKQGQATVAVLPTAKTAAETRALAVLEQMYGYFSFDPMPMEEAEIRQAA